MNFIVEKIIICVIMFCVGVLCGKWIITGHFNPILIPAALAVFIHHAYPLDWK